MRIEEQLTTCIHGQHLIYVIHTCTYEHNAPNRRVYLWSLKSISLGSPVASMLPEHTSHTRASILGKQCTDGWRDGSALKSTCYSCRGPGLGSQHPHSISQPSVTEVLYPHLSSKDSCTHRSHITHTQTHHTHMYLQDIHIHIKFNKERRGIRSDLCRGFLQVSLGLSHSWSS